MVTVENLNLIDSIKEIISEYGVNGLQPMMISQNGMGEKNSIIMWNGLNISLRIISMFGMLN